MKIKSEHMGLVVALTMMAIVFTIAAVIKLVF